MDSEAVEALVARLEQVAEEIADLGHAKLRQAIEQDSPEAAADERRLGRARRAVLKAIALLSRQAADEDGT